MNKTLSPIRLLVTLLFVAVAAIVAWQLWAYYMLAPWTRDGAVRADVVEIAPDVSGLVAEVDVRDNESVVVGQPLFQVDPARFALALDSAKANLARAQATLANAERDAARFNALPNAAVAGQAKDQSNATALEAQAGVAAAQAEVGVAELNLQRATVRATVPGIVTNFSMRPGDYVRDGTPVAALVDTASLYVDGYFEETKLPRIRIGDPATVTLLGGGPPITGHVQSIAAGITDPERGSSQTLLADVNPTFTWVRLPERIPVRIQLDHVPAGTRLIAGLTATVAIKDK
jgi:RND family efflux transporter MFP subunit